MAEMHVHQLDMWADIPAQVDVRYRDELLPDAAYVLRSDQAGGHDTTPCWDRASQGDKREMMRYQNARRRTRQRQSQPPASASEASEPSDSHGWHQGWGSGWSNTEWEWSSRSWTDR